MPFIAAGIEAVVAIFGAVGSFVAAAGVIGQGLIMAGIGIAASYLISALTPKPQANGSQVSGVNFERDYGTNVSRQVACGPVALAGHDIYVNTYALSNAWLQQVYVVSDYPVTALTRVWAGGNLLQLGTATDARGRPVIGPSTVSFADGLLVFIKFVDGRQTAADSELVAQSNPGGRWSTSDIGIGVAHVIVTMEYQQDINNSFPDFFFEFQGAPLYDPRKDDTNGGVGAHRWGNIATHEYSANPAVIEYNYRRGFTFNSDFFCGMDMPSSDLPSDKFAAAANICDEIQADGKPRYQCSILLNCMSTHSDNLQSIALSCGAMQIDTIDGSWPLVGSDQSVVMTFTDTDIISTAQNFRRTEKQSMGTLVNSVSGNFPDPNQLWSMTGYDPQIAADFVVIDRRTRDINMDFPQVPSQRQADQLAWIYLYENRFETTATVTLRPRFQTLEAGDWVNWDSVRYGGVKTFIVTGKQLLSLDSADGPRNAVLTLQQRDGMIYDGVTPIPIVLPFPAGDPVYMSEVDSFAAIAVNVVGVNGVAQAGIRVSWNAIADVTIVQVDIEYYPTGDAGSAIHKIVTADQTVVVVAEGIVGNTEYTVRARIIAAPMRTTTFNAGVTVTTTNSLYGIQNFNDGLAYQTTSLLNKFADQIANLEAQISSVQSNASGRQWNNKQMVQKQLMSVTGNLTASITEVMTVATDTQTAFASLETTVTASIGDLSATVTENTTAIADINTGLVASWSMTLNVAGHISGLKQLNDGTTASFVIDTDVFQIANPAAFGNAAQTVFTLQTVSGVTQMALRGDFIADGIITARNIVTGGINAVDVVASGTITSASGVIGNLAVKSFSIGDNAVTVPVAQTLATGVTGANTSSLLSVSSVSLSIDTTGLAGKSITIVMSFHGQYIFSSATQMNTIAALTASLNGGAATTLSALSTAGSPQSALDLNNSYTFTASGGTDTVSIAVGWNGLVDVGSLVLGSRTLWALAAKR